MRGLHNRFNATLYGFFRNDNFEFYFRPMHWLLSKTCLLLLAIGLVFSARAQVNNINPSIKIIDGEPYYEHTVQKGQTLAQIAEAYFCSFLINYLQR